VGGDVHTTIYKGKIVYLEKNFKREQVSFKCGNNVEIEGEKQGVTGRLFQIVRVAIEMGR